MAKRTAAKAVSTIVAKKARCVDSGLPFDLETGMALLRSHPATAHLPITYGLPPLYTEANNVTKSHFQATCYTIFSQQVADTAALSMYERFLEVGGGTPNAVLSEVGWCLTGPAPTKRNDIVKNAEHFHALREKMGTSGAKLASVIAVAASWQSIEVLLNESPVNASQLRETLTGLHGVGPWSVDMILMFKFRLPDILPVGDLAFRRGLAATFEVGRELNSNKKEDVEVMEEIGEQFEGYRSVLSWYMYRVCDASKKNSKKKTKKEK